MSKKKIFSKKVVENQYNFEPDFYNDEDMETRVYIKSKLGVVYDFSGNPEEKLNTIRKSMMYWKERQNEPNGVKFYDNFVHLYKQALLLLETNKELKLT